MWTVGNRSRYDRTRLRYPSDVTDEEWALIPPAKRGGRQLREVTNGIIYILSTGCQWGYIPKDGPPKTTIFNVIDRIHHALYVQCREMAGREASPTACVIDSQSVKSAEKGGSVSTRMVLTRARKSKVKSAISSSIRKAC